MAQARFGLDLFHFQTFLRFKAIPMTAIVSKNVHYTFFSSSSQQMQIYRLFFSSQPLDGRVVETQNALKWIVHADAMRSLTLLQK